MYPSSQDMLHEGDLTHGHDYSTNCQDSKDTNDKFISIRSQERDIKTTGPLKYRPFKESLKLLFELHGTVEDLTVAELCSAAEVIDDDVRISLSGYFQQSQEENIIREGRLL